MTSTGAFRHVGPFQFNTPKEFSGRREDFEEFVFKLKAYLGLVNPEYRVHLSALQDKTEELTDEYFMDEDDNPKLHIVQLSTHLQWLLVSLCSGPSSTFLRRDSTENGFESFRKLCQRYMLPGRVKSVGRLTKILNPNFNMENFKDSFSSWEGEIGKYTK